MSECEVDFILRGGLDILGFGDPTAGLGNQKNREHNKNNSLSGKV